MVKTLPSVGSSIWRIWVLDGNNFDEGYTCGVTRFARPLRQTIRQGVASVSGRMGEGRLALALSEGCCDLAESACGNRFERDRVKLCPPLIGVSLSHRALMIIASDK